MTSRASDVKMNKNRCVALADVTGPRAGSAPSFPVRSRRARSVLINFVFRGEVAGQNIFRYERSRVRVSA